MCLIPKDVQPRNSLALGVRKTRQSVKKIRKTSLCNRILYFIKGILRMMLYIIKYGNI